VDGKIVQARLLKFIDATEQRLTAIEQRLDQVLALLRLEESRTVPEPSAEADPKPKRGHGGWRPGAGRPRKHPIPEPIE
jgi:hypothetical protein